MPNGWVEGGGGFVIPAHSVDSYLPCICWTGLYLYNTLMIRLVEKSDNSETVSFIDIISGGTIPVVLYLYIEGFRSK